MADKAEEKVTVEEKTLKAKELYGRGCRNYYVKNYSEAADDLSDACELYGQIYGVDGDELGEVYLLYAKALIAVGREENKLVDVQEEDEDDENDEEYEECAENVEKDPEEKSTDPVENSNDPEQKPKDPEADSMDQEDTEVEAKEPETEIKNADTVKGEEVLANGHSSDDNKDSEAGPSSDQKNPEDPAEANEEEGNFEVAWEVLQNAAQIFQKQEDKGLLQLLDVYNEMAGISIENGNFEVALEDFARALAVFDRIEESSRNYRISAEIHYRVGLCQTLEKSYDESIKSFQKAHDLLSDVIEKEKSKEQTDDVAANIKDMEETKQEILNKINETGDVKADEVEKVKKELAKFYSKMNGSGDNSSQQSGESATDISHLVKRKKPDVTDSKIESSPAKKQVIETEEAIMAVPADDEKKKIEDEESVQPAIEN